MSIERFKRLFDLFFMQSKISSKKFNLKKYQEIRNERERDGDRRVGDIFVLILRGT